MLMKIKHNRFFQITKIKNLKKNWSILLDFVIFMVFLICCDSSLLLFLDFRPFFKDSLSKLYKLQAPRPGSALLGVRK